MKILIADDDEIFMRLIAFKLGKEESYQIYTATDGKRAIQLAKQTKPEVVITDILMPFASGLELIEYVRKCLSPETFIIAISTAGLATNMQEAYDMGADDFIAKPFPLEDLLVKISNVLPTNSTSS